MAAVGGTVYLMFSVCVCTDIELVHHPERMQSHTHSHAEVQQLENTKKNPCE